MKRRSRATPGEGASVFHGSCHLLGLCLLTTVSLATPECTSASEALDDRGQPKVSAQIDLVWDPLTPCGWKLTLRSNTTLGQLVSLRATDGTDGYRVEPGLPRLYFVPALGDTFAADFACTGETAPSEFKGVTWYQTWSPPPGKARHAADAVYRLPFEAGATITVAQDVNGTATHHLDLERAYAVDFDVAEGTPVHAARGGTVVMVEDRFHLGSKTDVEYFGARTNQVVVAHDDGTYGIYAHLQHRGTRVQMGQEVSAGELVALAGSTGYSELPHLHFAVARPLLDGRTQSFPLLFHTKEHEGPVELQEGYRYTVVDR